MSLPHTASMVPPVQVVCRHRGGCLVPLLLGAVLLMVIPAAAAVIAGFFYLQKPLVHRGPCAVTAPVSGFAAGPQVTPPAAEVVEKDGSFEIRVRHQVRDLSVRTGADGDLVSWRTTAALVNPAGRQVEVAERARIATPAPEAEGVPFTWTFRLPGAKSGEVWKVRLTARDEMTGGVTVLDTPVPVK